MILPIRTQPETNLREHWAAKAKRVRAQRQAVALGMAVLPRPALPCLVTLTRIAPGTMDDDNLPASMKAIRDELAVWLGLPRNKRGIANDRDPRVRWAYDQRRGGVREYAVDVTFAAFDPRFSADTAESATHAAARAVGLVE